MSRRHAPHRHFSAKSWNGTLAVAQRPIDILEIRMLAKRTRVDWMVNRFGLEKFINDESWAYTARKHPIVAIVDVDGFKPATMIDAVYRRRRRPEGGRGAINQSGPVLREARYGGDEFVSMPNTTTIAGARRVGHMVFYGLWSKHAMTRSIVIDG